MNRDLSMTVGNVTNDAAYAVRLFEQIYMGLRHFQDAERLEVSTRLTAAILSSTLIRPKP